MKVSEFDGRSVLVSVFIAIFLSGCSDVDEPSNLRRLRLCGPAELLPLLSDLTLSYSKFHPEIDWDVKQGTARGCLDRLEYGDVDTAVCSPEMMTAEPDAPQLRAIPFAFDAVAIVVHPSYPISDMTLAALHSLYAGRVLNWEELGGVRREIDVIYREDDSSIRGVFERKVMGGRSATPTAIVLPSGSATVEFVGRHIGAIGYVSMGYLFQMDRALETTANDRVKVLRIEGEHPTPETVARGSYHLDYPLSLVVRSDVGAESFEWIQYALRTPAQNLIGDSLAKIR